MEVNKMPAIENTTIETRYKNDGSVLAYQIRPNTGYVLHSKGYDTPVFDEETLEETGDVILGFTSAFVGVGYNYDFNNVVADTYTYTDQNNMEVTMPISKVGRFEIFAIPASIVPENQIFGGGATEPDHEVM